MLDSKKIISKNSYKLISFYSMPSSILFVFRKRLNFVYSVLLLAALCLL